MLHKQTEFFETDDDRIFILGQLNLVEHRKPMIVCGETINRCDFWIKKDSKRKKAWEYHN